MQEQQRHDLDRHDLMPALGTAPGPEPSLDWGLLGGILRRRAGTWAALGPLLAAGLLLALLRWVPPAYTSTASVSMQQESGGAVSGALSALSGLGGGGTKSYLGVIRSRRFADAAARQAGIQALYGLPTADDATDLVQKCVSLEDRADGLLYLGATLPGPPRLSPGARTQEARVRLAAKSVTDSYVGSLGHYLETSNSDRGAALLRQAGKQRDAARDAYNDSVRRLSDLAASDVSPAVAGAAAAEAAPATANAGASGDAPKTARAAGGDGGLGQLYVSRGQIEAEIQAAQAEQSGASRLAAGPVADLSALPAEDPLLAEARAQVRRADSDLQTLRIDLADDNPDVVAARQRLAEAQARLLVQSRAVQHGRTSESVQIGALQAKLGAVTHQIGAAEQEFKAGRRFGAEAERRRNDVLLHLEVYKTAATQYAILSMQTVAGGSLMDVVDAGRAPAVGKPGVGLLAGVSVGAALFALNLWLCLEYLACARREARRRLLAGRETPRLEIKSETPKSEAQNGAVPR